MASEIESAAAKKRNDDSRQLLLTGLITRSDVSVTPTGTSGMAVVDVHLDGVMVVKTPEGEVVLVQRLGEGDLSGGGCASLPVDVDWFWRSHVDFAAHLLVKRLVVALAP